MFDVAFIALGIMRWDNGVHGWGRMGYQKHGDVRYREFANNDTTRSISDSNP